MIRTRRLELLERHSQTTGITQWADGHRLGPSPGDCEAAALLICGHTTPADAAEALRTLGLLAPEGVPLRAAFRVNPATRPGGAVPVPGIRRKRPRQ